MGSDLTKIVLIPVEYCISIVYAKHDTLDSSGRKAALPESGPPQARLAGYFPQTPLSDIGLFFAMRSLTLEYSEDVNPCHAFAMIVLLSKPIWPQAAGRYPEPEEYPATEVYHGQPMPPRITRPGDRLFRTIIRQGAAKGPNFAGHYTIAAWGCGSACVSTAVIDARDGRVYSSPFGILGWDVQFLKYEGKYVPYEEGFTPLAYKLDTRLLIVRGCPEDKDCASYFYEWTGVAFKLIRKVAAVPVSRP
jgi:hypothetical protein